MGRCSQVMRPRRNARYAAALFGRAVISATGTFWLLGGGGGGGEGRSDIMMQYRSRASHGMTAGTTGGFPKPVAAFDVRSSTIVARGGGGGKVPETFTAGLRCSMFDVRGSTPNDSL